MKITDKIRTYCRHCNTHTEHKVVRVVKKGKASPFAKGIKHHKWKLKGYTGKVAGEKPVKKRGKHQKILLECTTCKKRSERIVGTRTTKVLEIVKGG